MVWFFHAGHEQKYASPTRKRVYVFAPLPATLVDNSASKLCKATEPGGACVHGVHFTAAWAREASDAERRKWIYLQDLGFKA